jgi:O-antigen/teichoic acid export membrane protein
MLSDMESSELRERLRVAERAAAAPYVDYPPTPRWYPPAAGLWSVALVLVVGLPTHSDVWRPVGLCLLVAVNLVFVRWYRRYRGTAPRGRAPREIRRVMAAFVVGAVVIVAGAALLVWLASAVVAAVVAFVVVTGAIAWYERVYARAADRTRERLG